MITPVASVAFVTHLPTSTSHVPGGGDLISANLRFKGVRKEIRR